VAGSAGGLAALSAALEELEGVAEGLREAQHQVTAARGCAAAGACVKACGALWCSALPSADTHTHTRTRARGCTAGDGVRGRRAVQCRRRGRRLVAP
jgi:hypothetical protein